MTSAGRKDERQRSAVLSWSRARGLTVYLSASYAVSVVLLAVMAVHALGAEIGVPQLVAVLALSMFVDLPLIDIRKGHDVESFTFDELCVVLAIAIVPLPWAVLLASACVLAFGAARRIQLPKATFNAATFAVGMSAAGAVAHAVAPGGFAGAPLQGLLGLGLGSLVFFLVNSGGVALAVALSQGVPFRSVYRRGLAVRLGLAGLNTTIALLVLVLADWSPTTLLMLPPVLLALYASYRGYLQAANERDVWQQLEAATREFNSLDVPTVISASLSRSAQLFKADVVTIALQEASGTTVHTGDASGLLCSADDRDQRLTAAAGTGADGTRDPLTVYSAPLEGPRGRIGVLELGFRGPVELRRREQQVLRTLAHAISSTLQNARLYSEMRSHAEAKAYEAAHDALTGLGNRNLLQEIAGRTIASAAERGTQCALLIVDLDHFKEINDTLGHGAGDLLLRQVGQRIAAAVPQADAVCRLGGDEFAVLVSGPAAADADALAAELLRVLAEPAVFDGLRLSVEGSVGIACAPQDATSFDELLKRADVALYQAKDTRGAFAHYSAERDGSSLDRLALVAELRVALSEDQLVVHFQPQYELLGRRLIGAEALVRWQHPQRGLLPPSEFISAVEHSGLIRAFTLTVLEKAVAEAAAWSGSGRTLSVAVNLSARNLLDRELPADVARVLQRHGLAPERLVLEITETTMMSELDVVEDVLAHLRRLGVELSVDDFGTGFSSLAFLQRVQVNEVKVDRSFVAGLADSDNARALVRATVQLAHSLGARAVGEGVEDEALAAVLRELGCDYGQGYHLGRPMPAEGMRSLLGMLPGGAVRPEPEPRRLRSVVVLPG